ncbi:cysteine desulfurase family protein [Candidatus Cardinium hertigii]|jgi:cysteine desulfurase|uniref:Cysteine desulfurase n=1 Tax=Candidatus Cardinium hertigii TaxID=247481 RepID=A0A3N2QAZ1_9BACT|nr:cysteine desulfurase family protein [Candidatus Cardinium hertigii]ROT46901.1 cysteine desulfurase [Candidatus Cardinium hertigii]
MDIYLDNAATTKLDPEVLDDMIPYMTNIFGNPSSIHRYGCRVKSAIEKARKKIAMLCNVSPSEILFTSGGTEGNNMLLRGIVEAMHIQAVLTSPLEHLSVRAPLEKLAQQGKITLTYARVNQSGDLFLDEIEQWLQSHSHGHALLSFMQVNHEIGNITDIVAIGQLCQKYNAFFHSDTIQSIYYLTHDFRSLQLAVGSAHKIHGPIGIGFVYIDPKVSITPLICGGSQELNMRGGTENVAHIVGMAKALEIAFRDRIKIANHLFSIKKYMIELLKMHVPNVKFNGHSESLTKSSSTLLNISLPAWQDSDMLIYNLAIHGIAASTGSACTSGSDTGSLVIAALQKETPHAIRFSFSKYTTRAEITKTVECLRQLCTS